MELKDQGQSSIIQSKIWRMLDIFHGENIRVEDYYVALLFLSLGRNQLLGVAYKHTGKEFYPFLEKALKEIGTEESLQFLPIIPLFEDSIKKLSHHGVNQLIFDSNGFNVRFNQEQFSEIFDQMLYAITKGQGRHGGEIIQPLELTKFLIDLADLPANASVFNPFAGLASFGVFLNQDQHYYAQEVNPKTWAIGQLRLMAYDRNEFSHFVCEDSVEKWPNSQENFDLVISHPPFINFSTLRRIDSSNNLASGYRSFEHFLLDQGIQLLNRNGKLIAILSQGFLFRGSIERQLREHLVDDDLIDTIISLPGGVLSNTGIPIIILVINRQKTYPNLTRFIDASNLVVKRSRLEKLVDFAFLKELIDSPLKNSEKVRIISREQIADNEYNLNIPRYFQKVIEGVKLRHLLEPIKGKWANKFSEGKLIKIKDLKGDKISFNLEIEKVEKVDLVHSQFKEIDKSCLLLATRWKTIKPTWFEYTNESIFLRTNEILPFSINPEIVDKAFLINELHADYVQEQLESFRLGGPIPVLRKEDLLEVIIKIPSLQEQKAKIQGIVEVTEKIKLLEKERNEISHFKTISHFNEFASLKHTLGRPRQNILDWTDNLLHFISTNREGFDPLNKAFHDFYETDILSALKEIKRDVNFMTDVLEKGENGFVVEEYEKTIISLSDVNSIINDLSSNGFKFKIKKLFLKGEKLKERGVFGNKTLLKILIDNLLTNANKYGFDKKTEANEVVFELKEVDDFLLIEVRNNGQPFPKNFDREKFITKYSTADSKSGSGLGGYDIHRIAVEFNNPDWELVLNEDLIYPVKFKFQFPIKLIN